MKLFDKVATTVRLDCTAFNDPVGDVFEIVRGSIGTIIYVIRRREYVVAFVLPDGTVFETIMFDNELTRAEEEMQYVEGSIDRDEQPATVLPSSPAQRVDSTIRLPSWQDSGWDSFVEATRTSFPST